MRSRFALVVVAALLLQIPARPYTFNSTGSPAKHDHWASPPHYVVAIDTGSNISGTGTRSVVQVINAAFTTWANAPNAAVIAIADPPLQQGQLSNNDGKNTICFKCSGDFSKDSSTLAITSTSTDANAQIVDADIAFNPSKNFTTDATAPGQTGQDLETVAVHEIGHFFGMSHSGVVRASMFPFAPAIERTLGYDDVMIAAQLYPASQSVSTHTISGTVRLAGNAVFGAHVVAESQTNLEPNGMVLANVRKTPISALTDLGGNYAIVVPDDTYLVFAEPLNLPMTNSDIQGYASSFGRTSVDTNFTTRWH